MGMRRIATLLAFLPALPGHLLYFQAPSPESCCRCEAAPTHFVCLTDAQMRKQVEHVEMAPDRMGNHVNFKGVAVFEVRVSTDGRVACAKSVSGHAIAVSLLMARADHWRFHPYRLNTTAVEACGRLRLRFSVSEHNQPTVEVE